MNNILVLLDQTNVDDINGNVYILGRQINQGEKTLEDLKLMFGRLVQ